MIGYTAIESALIDAILTVYPDELNEDRCQAGNLDLVLEAIINEDADYGVVLEFMGANPRTRHGFNRPEWTWVIGGVFFIKFRTSSSIETNLRTIVDRLPTIVNADPRLDGKTYKARVSDIGEPDMISINDQPFYMLPFVVEALDR